MRRRCPPALRFVEPISSLEAPAREDEVSDRLSELGVTGPPPGADVRRLAALTSREREVLALVAEGRSNGAVCRQLFLSAKTVECHMASIFGKLGLLPGPDDHRRVLAVLTWLGLPPVGATCRSHIRSQT